MRAGDEAALAAAFDALAVDSVASLAMGRNGRARLERDFGAETHLQRLDTVYEQAAARRGSSLPPSPTKGNS